MEPTMGEQEPTPPRPLSRRLFFVDAVYAEGGLDGACKVLGCAPSGADTAPSAPPSSAAPQPPLGGFLALLPRLSLAAALQLAAGETDTTPDGEDNANPTKRRRVGTPGSPADTAARLTAGLNLLLCPEDASASRGNTLAAALIDLSAVVATSTPDAGGRSTTSPPPATPPAADLLDTALSNPAAALLGCRHLSADPSYWGFLGESGEEVRQAHVLLQTVSLLLPFSVSAAAERLAAVWLQHGGGGGAAYARQQLTASFLLNAGPAAAAQVFATACDTLKRSDRHDSALACIDHSFDTISEHCTALHWALLRAWLASGLCPAVAAKRCLSHPPAGFEAECYRHLEGSPPLLRAVCELAQQAPAGGWALLRRAPMGGRMLLASAVLRAANGTRPPSEELRGVARGLLGEAAAEGRAERHCLALMAMAMLPEGCPEDAGVVHRCLGHPNAALLAVALTVYAHGRKNTEAGQLYQELLPCLGEAAGWAHSWSTVVHDAGMRQIAVFLPLRDVPDFLCSVDLGSFEPDVCRGGELLQRGVQNALNCHMMRTSSHDDGRAILDTIFTWLHTFILNHPSPATPGPVLASLSYIAQSRYPQFAVGPEMLGLRIQQGVLLAASAASDPNMPDTAKLAALTRLHRTAGLPLLLLLQNISRKDEAATAPRFEDEGGYFRSLLQAPIKALHLLLKERLRLAQSPAGCPAAASEASALLDRLGPLLDKMLPHTRISNVGYLYLPKETRASLGSSGLAKLREKGVPADSAERPSGGGGGGASTRPLRNREHHRRDLQGLLRGVVRFYGGEEEEEEGGSAVPPAARARRRAAGLADAFVQRCFQEMVAAEAKGGTAAGEGRGAQPSTSASASATPSPSPSPSLYFPAPPAPGAPGLREWQQLCVACPELGFSAMLAALTDRQIAVAAAAAGTTSGAATGLADRGAGRGGVLSPSENVPFLVASPDSDADVLMTVFFPEVLFGVSDAAFRNPALCAAFQDLFAYYVVACGGAASGENSSRQRAIVAAKLLKKITSLLPACATPTPSFDPAFHRSRFLRTLAVLCAHDPEVQAMLIVFRPPLPYLVAVAGEETLHAALGFILSEGASLRLKCYALGLVVGCCRNGAAIPVSGESLLVAVVSWVVAAPGLAAEHDVDLLADFFAQNPDAAPVLAGRGVHSRDVFAPAVWKVASALATSRPLSAKSRLRTALQGALRTAEAHPCTAV